MATTYQVQVHDGKGWNAFVKRNDEGNPVFTFIEPEPLARLAAEHLHCEAIRRCGGTLRVVPADE